MNIKKLSDHMHGDDGQRSRAIFFHAKSQEWAIRVIAACAENQCVYTSYTEDDGSIVICVTGTPDQLRGCTDQLKSQMPV